MLLIIIFLKKWKSSRRSHASSQQVGPQNKKKISIFCVCTAMQPTRASSPLSKYNAALVFDFLHQKTDGMLNISQFDTGGKAAFCSPDREGRTLSQSWMCFCGNKLSCNKNLQSTVLSMVFNAMLHLVLSCMRLHPYLMLDPELLVRAACQS